MSDKAELHYEGNVYELPIIEGTQKEKGLDISRLRAESGLITLDKGFKNTGSTESAVTFLNGEDGLLKYRGYSIEELANKSSFVEVSYLLIYGELPTPNELKSFKEEITYHTLVHEDVKIYFRWFSFKVSSNGGSIIFSIIINGFLPKVIRS